MNLTLMIGGALLVAFAAFAAYLLMLRADYAGSAPSDRAPAPGPDDVQNGA